MYLVCGWELLHSVDRFLALALIHVAILLSSIVFRYDSLEECVYTMEDYLNGTQNFIMSNKMYNVARRSICDFSILSFVFALSTQWKKEKWKWSCSVRSPCTPSVGFLSLSFPLPLSVGPTYSHWFRARTHSFYFTLNIHRLPFIRTFAAFTLCCVWLLLESWPTLSFTLPYENLRIYLRFTTLQPDGAATREETEERQ